MSKTSETLNPAIAAAGDRIAVLDLSTLGSYPSYYLSNNHENKEVKQVFGWAWQGATTSSNIMRINTAIEKEWYPFLFDRCRELGADTLILKKDKFKNGQLAVAEAAKAGYEKLLESGDMIVLKYPVNYSFGTKVKYEGFGIGKYAGNISFLFPVFETGSSYYIDDYDENTLLNYRVLFLSGFKYKDKEKAERLIKSISQKGVRVIVDMTNAESEIYTSQPRFLDVVAEPVTFTGSYPVFKVYNHEVRLESKIPLQYPEWRTVFLENMDKTFGEAEFSSQNMHFLGTSYNDNIFFIGFNIPFFAAETKDKDAIGLLENITGLKANRTPERTVVKMDAKQVGNILNIKCEKEGTVTGIAGLDSFKSIKGSYTIVDNLIKAHSKELALKIAYPYFKEGLLLSMLGLAAFILLCTGCLRKLGKALFFKHIKHTLIFIFIAAGMITFPSIALASEISLNGNFDDWSGKPQLNDAPGDEAAFNDFSQVKWFPDNSEGKLFLYCERLAGSEKKGNKDDWNVTVNFTTEMGNRRAYVLYHPSSRIVSVTLLDADGHFIWSAEGKWGEDKGSAKRIEFYVPLSYLVNSMKSGYQFNMLFTSGNDRVPDNGAVTVSSVSTFPWQSSIVLAGFASAGLLTVRIKRKGRIKGN